MKYRKIGKIGKAGKAGKIGRSYLAQKPPRPLSRGRKYLFLLFFLLLVLSAVYAANLASSVQSFHNSEEWAQSLRRQGPGKDVFYLLMGVDYWGANPYVERLVLVHHDTVSRRLNVVCIPGNTAIGAGGGAVQALGQLYRFQKGEPFIRLVQEFLGLPVHHYITVNYQGLVDLANHLGGVAAGDLGPAPDGFLPADKELLNGFEVYRYFLTGDYQETPGQHLERQRRVFIALWRKLEGKKPWQWPRLAGFIGEYVETDLSWRELQQLRERFAQLPFNQARVIRLPGERQIIDGLTYWVTDREAVREMVRMINEGYLVVPAEVRVEVLNGYGVAGAASRVAEILEREGFIVVKTGNADRFDYQQTEVIALEPVVDKARAVSLYLPDSSLLHRPDPAAGADVRVIVGHVFARSP